jgi:hypothetical protein
VLSKLSLFEHVRRDNTIEKELQMKNIPCALIAEEQIWTCLRVYGKFVSAHSDFAYCNPVDMFADRHGEDLLH